MNKTEQRRTEWEARYQAGATGWDRGGPPFHCELADMRALFPAERRLWPGQSTRIPHPSRAELHELGFVLTRR